MKKLSPRVWLTLILVGMVGQFAWTIENMYFNVYLYNTISTDPGYISAMVGWSAAAATLTTLLLRCCGIPARYVEGYVVTRQQAEALSDGAQLTLTQRAAPAGGAYYMGGGGWLPVATLPRDEEHIG